MRQLLMMTGALLLLASPALAGNHSVLTVGVGAGLGVHHAGQPDEQPESQVVTTLNMRAKALWFLGADVSYSMSEPAYPGDELQFGARYRATALIYPIPTKWVGVYLGAGIGASRLKDLTKVTASSNSYHVGGGMEVHITRHVTLDGSFFMVVPGYASIERDVTRRALSEVDERTEDLAAIDSLEDLEALQHNLPVPDIGVRDYISPRNFEVILRGMVFF